MLLGYLFQVGLLLDLEVEDVHLLLEVPDLVLGALVLNLGRPQIGDLFLEHNVLLLKLGVLGQHSGGAQVWVTRAILSSFFLIFQN